MKKISLIWILLLTSCSAGSNCAFISACSKGDIESIEEFIQDGVKIDSLYCDGWTGLTAASEAGMIHSVELLLRKGADVDLEEAGGNSALFWASRGGHVEVVELLLRSGASINPRSKTSSGDPLYVAIVNSKINVVQVLLNHGANPNRKSYDGDTPLQIAEKLGNSEILELIHKEIRKR